MPKPGLFATAALALLLAGCDKAPAPVAEDAAAKARHAAWVKDVRVGARASRTRSA